ncbi:MAG: hypothetical protein LVQ95_03190 [Candidatus Micrarchaeales archaeon]|nr:hypothetical protein [Candidatus Micrarchaeales archaeon]
MRFVGVTNKAAADKISCALKEQSWIWRWSGNCPVLDEVPMVDPIYYGKLKELAGAPLKYNLDRSGCG